MKTIGLIGGVSYESTTHYYQRINDEVNKRAGGLTSAKMIVYSVNFAEIRESMLKNDWDSIYSELMNAAKNLQRAGADCVAIASNTMHKIALDIQWELCIPFIHIADCVAKNCKEAGISKVGLLGTKFTMLEDFLISRLEENSLEVCVPENADDIDEIDRIIFDELCKGEIKSTSKERYIQIANMMVQKNHIQGLILGCTEIEMLLKEGDVSVPLFDTTQSHVEALAEYCLS